MTNREWLETLTDEHLAYVFVEIGCGCCAYTFAVDCPNMKPHQFDQANCVEGTTKWLKQEHKEDLC